MDTEICSPICRAWRPQSRCCWPGRAVGRLARWLTTRLLARRALRRYPDEAGRLLESASPEEGATLLESLPVVAAAEVPGRLSPETASRLIVSLSAASVVGLFESTIARYTALAVTTAAAVFLWSRSVGLSLVILILMIISMVAAGLSGAGIPMLLTAAKQDPAQSSSIILTTVTDVVGFFSFLGIATLLSGML